MKGILKLSTLALSAAMVAGLSTPVFAAGVGVNETTGTTITVTDKDGHPVATTNSKTTVLNLDGTTKANQNNKNKLTLYLAPGDVKKLTATSSDEDTTVKWSFDTDQSDSDLKAEKDALSISSDGTITVAKNFGSVGTATLYAYTDDALFTKTTTTTENNGTSTSTQKTELDTSKAIEVDVIFFKPVNVELKFDNADNYYTVGEETTANTDADGKGLGYTLATLKTNTDELPTVTHTSADINANKNYAVNHIGLTESATFTAKLVKTAKTASAAATYSDADYNTLLTFTENTPAETDEKIAKKFLSVKQNSESNQVTVTCKGTPTENGLVKISANYKGVFASAVSSDTLYAICDATETEHVYRLYNPNTGEHFYTVAAKEAQNLEDNGWRLEMVAWDAPKSGTPVYRVYNSNSGEHHYTTSEKEKNALVAAGWTDENIAFYSASKEYTPVYREYNKNAFAFNHHYTQDYGEYTILASIGWQPEGVAFYEFDSTLGTHELAQEAVDAALE